jgi:RHS repeat-associated protein
VRGNSSYDWEFLYHGEFRDKESELYNYGYRYLDTQLGRWLSRDPIGERGGVNLYGFASNNSITLFDRYGLVAPRPYIPEYETAREAIIAGGQYALQRADANLKERQVKFDQTPKEQRVGETRPTQVYEYCGLVCCTPGEDGKKMYYFAEAAGGYAVEHCSLLGAPECIKPHKVAGLYHNHPDYSSFSKADRRRSIARGVPIGVTRRHPRGHIETDIRQPNGEIEERINHDNLDSAN